MDLGIRSISSLLVANGKKVYPWAWVDVDNEGRRKGKLPRVSVGFEDVGFNYAWYPSKAFPERLVLRVLKTG